MMFIIIYINILHIHTYEFHSKHRNCDKIYCISSIPQIFHMEIINYNDFIVHTLSIIYNYSVKIENYMLKLKFLKQLMSPTLIILFNNKFYLTLTYLFYVWSNKVKIYKVLFICVQSI